jgi:hypothetical protein
MEEILKKINEYYPQDENYNKDLARELCVLFNVSDSAEHDFSKDKYEVKWLINDTYQVERNGKAELQADKKSCEDYARLCMEHFR